MRIAFIGLGNMGGGMAANLAKAGHDVRAFDLSETALAQAREAGCTGFSSAKEAVQGVDAVVSMLPNGQIVDKVYTDEVIGHAPQGALMIDCSTIDVATARKVIEAAEKAGYDMVDAPVSGGIAAANGGTLTFMVGGTDTAFERAETVLNPMAKAVIRAGEGGAGQVAKMCNNMILGISMIAVSEAFSLADKVGLGAQTLFDVVSTASGQCWSLTSYCPVPGPVPTSPANRNYQAGFTSDMMLKDLRLAQQSAGLTGAATPLGAEAEAIYSRYCKSGNGASDFSGIIRMITEK